MIIAINTRFMLSGQMEGYGNFIYETFSRIATQHPEHTFIYIFDKPFDEGFITSENITSVVAGPPATYPLLWKYWYALKIPSILKKVKADVFVSFDRFCSLKTLVPQCLVVKDLTFLTQPLLIRKSHAAYIKKTFPKHLKKAKAIITFSEELKNDLIKHYQVEDIKITTVYSGTRAMAQPVLASEKSAIKNKYTEGKEFFVYAGYIHSGKNLINLLKAFSVFKKRQQTNMKLVLAGTVDPGFKTFKKDLQSYRYRNDVVLIDSMDEAAFVKMIGTAYAFVNPSMLEEFPVEVIEAMKMEVPVISVETNTLLEIDKESILFTEEKGPTGIAEKMMLLYKDEKRRNDLILKGSAVAATYNWDSTAQLLWQCIVKTYS